MKPQHESDPLDPQEITAFRESVYRSFSDCLLRPPRGPKAGPWEDAEWHAALLRVLGLAPSDLRADDPWLADASLLDVEYARLFVVPATQTCPFESYYSTERPATEDVAASPLLGNAASAVRETYRSWGLRPEQETEEVPDHAATELRFMAMLAGIEGQVRAAGATQQLAPVLRAQADFLNQHILPWFPAWIKKVQMQARLPFYRTLMGLLARFLELDRSTLTLYLRSSEGDGPVNVLAVS